MSEIFITYVLPIIIKVVFYLAKQSLATSTKAAMLMQQHTVGINVDAHEMIVFFFMGPYR